MISTAVAGWALLRPAQVASSEADSAYSAEATDEARTKACEAFKTVRAAVALQTHLDLGPEPVAQQAVAGNARLSMLGGGVYLLEQLDPAAPAEVADGVRSFAEALQGVAINALAGVSNEEPAQADRLRAAEEASTNVADLCK